MHEHLQSQNHVTIWHTIRGFCGRNSGQQHLEDQLESLNWFWTKSQLFWQLVNSIRVRLYAIIWMSCVQPNNSKLIWIRPSASLTHNLTIANSSEQGHQPHSLTHWTSTTLTDLIHSLRDILIPWDHDYQHCEFPRESDAFYQTPSYTCSTSNNVHHGKSLQQYLEADRIHQEYLQAAKHFEYQKWCRAILSRRVCCPWQCNCEHCKQKKNRTKEG